MKRIFLLFALTLVVASCNNSEEKTEKSDTEKYGPAKRVNPKMKDAEATLPIYRGEFVYVDDAAVLKGVNFIYGVVIDEKAMELVEKVKPAKTEDFDMVKVAVKGLVSKKEAGAEGWEEILTIKEIIFVDKKASQADIKIQEKKN